MTNGYGATSLKDIAKAADVSTGTLYRYFPSKADLLFRIRRISLDNLHRVAEDLPEAMPLVDKLCAVIREDMASVSQGIELERATGETDPRVELALAVRSESYGSLEQLKQEHRFQQELQSIYRVLIEHEQTQGRFDASIDAEGLSQTVAALYFQAVDEAILEGGLDVVRAMRPKLETLFRDAACE